MELCEQGFLIPNKTSGEGGMNAMEYLGNIRESMVYESPLQLATRLLGVNMWLKREDLQPVDVPLLYNLCIIFVCSLKCRFSRGAYHMMAKLSKEQLDKGVICSSAIAMPVTTPEIKWKSFSTQTIALMSTFGTKVLMCLRRKGAFWKQLVPLLLLELKHTAKYYGLKDVNVVAITSSANMYFRRQTEITKTIQA
ncbi:hypothetical protein LIER_21465 [Lithospermum erythrorhizon]|uniref:Uncharacterized protein n=1 Tax=Lithospermum erythrorhizon TaxID=34254 RepID=A0AAV3QQB4_LITER